MKKRNIFLSVYILIHIICFGICIRACNFYDNENFKIQDAVDHLYMEDVNRISIIAKPKKSNHEYKFNITSKEIIKDFTFNLYSTFVHRASTYYECSYEIIFYTNNSEYAIEYRKSFGIPENPLDIRYDLYKFDSRTYKYSIPNIIYYDIKYQQKYFFRNNELIRKITFPYHYIAEDLVIPLSKYIDPLIKSKKNMNSDKVIEL
jgi:hypothetical protein